MDTFQIYTQVFDTCTSIRIPHKKAPTAPAGPGAYVMQQRTPEVRSRQERSVCVCGGGVAASMPSRKEASEISVISGCEVLFSLPCQVRFVSIDGEEARRANVW